MPDSVIISEVVLQRIPVTVVGISPLITHAWADERRDRIITKNEGKPLAPLQPKDLDREFQSSIYRTIDGKPGMILGAFKKAMIDAGRFIDDLPMTEITGLVFVLGPEIAEIVGSEPKRRVDWVRLSGKSVDFRARAQYDEWKVSFALQIRKDTITPESAINLLALAGHHVGVGNWRPEKKGDFGRFTVG